MERTCSYKYYDPEWEEFIDLDEDGEVYHKDKLKAVVSPLLSDSSVQNTNSKETKLAPQGRGDGMNERYGITILFKCSGEVLFFFPQVLP